MNLLLGGSNLFALLAMGHFLSDFGLQGDRMASEKCPGRGFTLGWGWWMASHAAIQGLLVALFTGLPLLGLAEWGVHALIDLGKCRGSYNLAFDQTLHLLCKLVWVLIALRLERLPAWLT